MSRARRQASKRQSFPLKPDWLDDDHPHDARRSRSQISALLKLLRRGRRKGKTPAAPVRVLDLGCGGGRTLAPLAAAGFEYVGLDRSAAAIRRCRAALARLPRTPSRATVRLLNRDFTQPNAIEHFTAFDAALCLGNTFMLITDVHRAVMLMRRIRSLLRPGGMFIIDDIPRDFWPELTGGNWQSGLSPDGRLQIVWRESDPIFALRRGRAIDTSSWSVRSSDTPLRLWCDGALGLAAAAAGLSAPRRLASAGLLIMKAPAIHPSTATLSRSRPQTTLKSAR